MAKTKNSAVETGTKTKSAEDLYAGKGGQKPLAPVNKDKEFVLIPYSDAVKIQRMNLFGIGRRMKRILKAHKLQHKLVQLDNVEVNKPRKRVDILRTLEEKKLAEEKIEAETKLAKLQQNKEAFELKKQKDKKLEELKQLDKKEAKAKAKES